MSAFINLASLISPLAFSLSLFHLLFLSSLTSPFTHLAARTRFHHLPSILLYCRSSPAFSFSSGFPLSSIFSYLVHFVTTNPLDL